MESADAGVKVACEASWVSEMDGEQHRARSSGARNAVYLFRAVVKIHALV